MWAHTCVRACVRECVCETETEEEWGRELTSTGSLRSFPGRLPGRGVDGRKRKRGEDDKCRATADEVHTNSRNRNSVSSKGPAGKRSLTMRPAKNTRVSLHEEHLSCPETTGT